MERKDLGVVRRNTIPYIFSILTNLMFAEPG